MKAIEDNLKTSPQPASLKKWLQPLSEVHKGMPHLEMGRPTSWFEFWPPKLFYFPVAIQWLLLAVRHHSLTLPTAANPNFPLGGLVGESKAVVMTGLTGQAKQRFARHISFDKAEDHAAISKEVEAVLDLASAEGLSLPFVGKPDMGCRGAGVQLIKSETHLATYLSEFPVGQRIIFQTYIPYEAEAGIFYVRPPGEKKGRVLSLTLKYFPYIFGDGQSSIRELILAEPRAGKLSHLYLPRHEGHLDYILPDGQAMRLAFTGSHSRGAIFRNGNHYITDEMSAAFDDVADGVPGFCFGRLDARFPSLEALQQGGEFHLMEINGAGGEAAHIWDSRTTLWQAYRSLAWQFRVLFEIGAANRALGHKPSSIREVFNAWRDEKRMTAVYPPTE